MRCPVCKADNTQSPQCRRCRADLSLLFALEAQRERTLKEVRRCLQRGEWQTALDHAEAADWMHCDERSGQLLALGHLLAGDFADAWRYYQRRSQVRSVQTLR